MPADGGAIETDTDWSQEVHIDNWDAAERGGRAEKMILDRAVQHIELGLAADDPDFVRHMRRLQGREVINAVAVFILLAAGVVLVIVGMATQTWTTWLAGGSALLCSLVVDARHQRSIEHRPFP